MQIRQEMPYSDNSIPGADTGGAIHINNNDTYCFTTSEVNEIIQMFVFLAGAFLALTIGNFHGKKKALLCLLSPSPGMLKKENYIQSQVISLSYKYTGKETVTVNSSPDIKKFMKIFRKFIL